MGATDLGSDAGCTVCMYVASLDGALRLQMQVSSSGKHDYVETPPRRTARVDPAQGRGS